MNEIIFKQAKAWILEAGELIRKKINDPLVVDTKANANDLVTTIDRETEEFLATNIKETYPNHFILSEEGFGDNISTLDGVVWIIDPIDGTINFVNQKRNFAISIGIFIDGIGEMGFVYDVMAGNLYSAKRGEGAYKNDRKLRPLKKDLQLSESILGLNHKWLCENTVVDEKEIQKLVKRVRGTRAYGSAALKLAFLAEGIIDSYITMNLAPWDIAGGMVLVAEVGGVTKNIDGKSVNMIGTDSTVSCHPAILEDLLEVMKKGRK
ncbi:inositol monophosphatase family protein [Pseudogracilibacillus sp. SE30717A]|uniref:inositol monophosphatase family protein n=1 Tax=Pseudogracilibacillus sp. SE30717A TaxID=3098293 RepID=UPI00300DDDAD